MPLRLRVQMRDSCDPGGGGRMTRGWWYTKLSSSSALFLPFSGMCFVLFLSFIGIGFGFGLSLSLELCRCSFDRFLSSSTTYRIGNHVYYWARLKSDRLMSRTHTHTHTSSNTAEHGRNMSPASKHQIQSECGE